MRFSRAVVKHRITILIVAIVLMVPSLFGMLGTRINYDMLDYLPEDMDTVIGQEELLSDFGKGAFSLIVVEDMEDKDVAVLFVTAVRRNSDNALLLIQLQSLAGKEFLSGFLC